MKGLADGMQVTTNNLANVSTIGFKQQNTLFSDLIYQTQASMGNWWNAQEDSRVAVGQVGMGLQIEAVRTNYTQGALESTNTLTDMAINGKGFFQVTDGSKLYYTRAGDFRQDKDGVWRTPSGLALNGYPLDSKGNRGQLSQVQILPMQTMPAKATSSINLTMNLGSTEDISQSEDNPYFALMQQYNAEGPKPLSASAYSASQAMTVYDANGAAHTVTAYFDSAPAATPNRAMEFVIASEVPTRYDSNGNRIQPESGDGLLMSGVLEFDSTGKLINISAFTPAVSGSQNLEDWVPASLVGGNPAFTLNGQQVSLNMGLSAAGNWQNAPANAAQIGANYGSLPQMGADASRADFPTTGYSSTAMVNSYRQNGYSKGILGNVSISSDGTVTGYFSNGQTQDLWEIPVARFTSEDGLRREGGNLFSWTEEAGQMQLGKAGTENYGTINAYNIENSNVDMAQEMVNMIITQRGFQSNSKVVTTANEMLQKAMELKRS